MNIADMLKAKGVVNIVSLPTLSSVPKCSRKYTFTSRLTAQQLTSKYVADIKRAQEMYIHSLEQASVMFANNIDICLEIDQVLGIEQSNNNAVIKGGAADAAHLDSINGRWETKTAMSNARMCRRHGKTQTTSSKAT